jgi:hypothetical protein
MKLGGAPVAFLDRWRFLPEQSSYDALIRVYDDAGNVIEGHDQAGEFKEW